jgi:hypothetical protein
MIKKLLLVLSGLALSQGAINSSQASEVSEMKQKLDTLTGEVSEMKTRLQQAEDYIAISNLMRIYGYYVDKSQADQIADLFSEKATLEIAGRGVFVGSKRIREFMHFLPQLKEGLLFNHMILQPVIHIAPDGKSAKARCRAFVQVGMLNKSATWGEGVYENEFVKEDGKWKISKLHFYPTYYNDFYKGWDKPGIPLFKSFDKLPPDLPPTVIYESYPGVYIPPYHYDNPVSGRKYHPE